MTFHRVVNGFDIRLRIDGYRPVSGHELGMHWCDCGFSFCFGSFIQYQKEHDELLLCEEVDALAQALTDLLEGRVPEPREEGMVEPDFVFWLYPVKDLRTDPRYTYIRPGFEFEDIRVEWRIYFWNGGLSGHFLTITLRREDVAALRDFLNRCIQGG